MRQREDQYEFIDKQGLYLSHGSLSGCNLQSARWTQGEGDCFVFLLCVVEKVRKKFAERLENARKKTRKCSETDRHKDRRLNWICQLNDGKVLQVWHAGAGQKAYIRHA